MKCQKRATQIEADGHFTHSTVNFE